MSSPVKTVTILGATGSIGQSAADVIAASPERFDVVTVTAHRNAEKLAETARRLQAGKAVISDAQALPALLNALEGTGIEAQAGNDALNRAAGEGVDLVLVAIVGIAGLEPVMRALESGRVVAIANKEPLVAAGPLVMAAARKHGTQILPVDSEHNAIFQVFDFDNPKGIEKIWLTASGGPFRTWSPAEMAAATPEQALQHPNWSMGPKITIDSATMMNKALEVIEAHYLFGLNPLQIGVVIHPQSIIHSMVECIDGSILAQMGASDMRTPIAHVLGWPQRLATPGKRLDLKALRSLSFEEPDHERFPALSLAYEALEAGPHACVALNAANEVAVDAFLTNRMSFADIIPCVTTVMRQTKPTGLSTIEEVIALDKLVRDGAQAYINRDKITKAAAAL